MSSYSQTIRSRNQLVAKKYGSQFTWQLYQAVLNKEKRQEFIKGFKSSRMKVAEAERLVQAAKPTVVVEGVG